MSEPTRPVPKRRYSYSPVFLVQDIIAVLQLHGVVVEMSAAERIREPVKAARHMLRTLHVHPKADAYPKDWWLKNTYVNPLENAPVVTVTPRRPAA